ncbi:Rrf2 family transcriptional regulator [Caproiciproducens sp. NJN-50]|uniref:RrF2 family transcriptional regulator n=1 Tax=Acutalibacteraceae TaxID=3082771 RepID=UPI000FFE1485|nr:MULTISPECIES: Rrf2 family transcriptional regulator [Acutalibacteraceae]QAT50404.1 Rrf2 family transcriptional regulator [Caproiciproducens sp. NJN-50]
MRISTKGRYGLASLILMAQKYLSRENVTVIFISEQLGISKIYLEQVFSLLKRDNIVISVKGSRGGYRLLKTPDAISVYEVLSALEPSLFEITESSVEDKAPEVERTMQKKVFDVINSALITALKKITLYDLARDAEKRPAGYMYYI